MPAAQSSNPPESPILVVDDNTSIREALRDVLEMEGYRVTEAENGRAALDRLSQQPKPCLVILDLIMPVMTGSEFLWAARTEEAEPHVPILVLSALSGTSWAARHADRALSKPIAVEVLLKAVADLCQ